MSFRIDTAAPKLPENIERLDGIVVQKIMDGAMEICASIQDNDSDIWHLTRAGQFVRTTGEDADRFFVWPIGEAFDYLDGMVADDKWTEVKSLLEAAGIALPPRAEPTPAA
jgi:hypothetical protein